MKKWLGSIAQIVVIVGGILGAPAAVDEENKDTAKDIAAIVGVVSALILKSPREKK